MITIIVNGKSFQVEPGTTIGGLIEGYNLNPAVIVVEYNSNIIDRQAYHQIEISEGDRLELVHFVGGG